MLTVTSCDLFLRIPLAELNDVGLEHLHSEIDRTIAFGPESPRAADDLRLTGYTEWTATMRGRQLSLGWDWYEIEPGVLAILHPTMLRTNVMLVDEHQVDLGGERTTLYLLALIRRTDWYSIVADYLSLPPAPSKKN